ncbi:uncharacterized protein TRAVEDRAFT_130387, partial [Trametes versicolor FP-101664 SS1]|uniref:uncharacterized protein n=1 Tax=Trametes versicolor (strain FP-101664) TaxID=717944 RepID=UPI00046213D2
TALFCFDYSVTLSREVEYIWKREFSTPTLLFYLVRYMGLITAVFAVMEVTGMLPTHDSTLPIQSTSALLRASRYADYLTYVVFAGLRAYAISGRNKWVLAIVLVLGLVNPTAYIVSLKLTTMIAVRTISSKFYVPILAADECAVSPGITLARVCAVVADIAVLVVTWRYMRPAIVIPGASQVDLPRANGNAIGSLANVLVKDGALILSRCVSANPAQLRAV